MDIVKPDGVTSKLMGQGEAKVLEVRSAAQNAHQVRVFHPDLGNTVFIPYIQTAGIYRVPRVGDVVFVFCRENFAQYPVAWGHKIEAELAAQLSKGADNILVIYGADANQKGISHKIELDDGADNGVRITTKGNNQVTMKNTGDIELKHNSGNLVKVNSGEILLSIGGSSIKLTAAGITITAGGGASITLGADANMAGAGGASVKAGADAEMSSSGGSSIKADSSVEIKSSDKMGKFDDITISTHDHWIVFPTVATSGGPVK